MQRLKLNDILLGLRDLFDKRLADLRLTKSGNFYEPLLAEQLSAITALPRQLTGHTPLADELEAIDNIHDGFGGAVFFITEAYLRLPGTSKELVDAAQRIRRAFIPSLAELGASYAIEAERAIERKPLLEGHKDDLQRFPVAGYGTLYDVAKGFLNAGEQLHQLLGDRSDMSPNARKEATTLRSATVGLLTRFREDLVRELQRNPALPRDLEQRVFAYFDTLEKMQTRSTAPIGSPY
jgi:hypothetical protein